MQSLILHVRYMNIYIILIYLWSNDNSTNMQGIQTVVILIVSTFSPIRSSIRLSLKVYYIFSVEPNIKQTP
jgi:hypothetical protein